MNASAATSESPAAHRLLLVREQDAQHSGSGCCGRLGESHSDLGGAADFSANRERMELLGVVYRTVVEQAPEVHIEVLDPRNWASLYPRVWRDARRGGQSVPSAARSLTRAGAPGAVVLDGQTIFSGRLPDSQMIVDAVLSRLDDQNGANDATRPM